MKMHDRRATRPSRSDRRARHPAEPARRNSGALSSRGIPIIVCANSGQFLPSNLSFRVVRGYPIRRVESRFSQLTGPVTRSSWSVPEGVREGRLQELDIARSKLRHLACLSRPCLTCASANPLISCCGGSTVFGELRRIHHCGGRRKPVDVPAMPSLRGSLLRYILRLRKGALDWDMPVDTLRVMQQWSDRSVTRPRGIQITPMPRCGRARGVGRSRRSASPRHDSATCMVGDGP